MFEQDLVQANKLAFGDEIGTTTNHITAMIERQSMFAKDSVEYQTLGCRIKCGQHYQQCAIDRAKGIIAKPMPGYWYDKAACRQLPEDTEAQKRFKELCMEIVAENKQHLDKDEVKANRNMMQMHFQAEYEKICPNEKELCDIVIDLCYGSTKSKQFAWNICGTVIVENLLEKNGNVIHYPTQVKSGGEFEFGGEQFIMCEKKYIKENEDL